MFTAETNQWVISIGFGLMWALIAGSNWRALLEARRRGGSTSLTLFLGGVFGVIAVLVCPLPGWKVWAWLPPLLDPGSLWAVVRILRSGPDRG